MKIPIYQPYIDSEELKTVAECIKSGWISSQGPYVKKFAEEFANYLGVKYAIPATSGTTALHLALAAIGIKSGDEVIMPDLTFVASANSVSYVGAKPVLVDVDQKNLTIDPLKIEEKITEKTKAIMVVHLYGQPAQMDKIIKIANKYKLKIIEDAAEALGAEFKGAKVGTIGEVGCFSFYGNKIITTGEGGMVTTNDKKIAENIIFLNNHARANGKSYYFHSEVGFNYRMTALQAAFGLAQMKKIKKILEKKAVGARFYKNKLQKLSDLTLVDSPSWGKSVFWLYTIFCKNEKQRNDLSVYLARAGIETRPVFYPLHLLPPYKEKAGYPVSENLAQGGLSLPSSPLLTISELNYITDKILAFFKKND